MKKEEQQLNVLFLASWYPTWVEPQNGNFIQRHAEAVALNCRVACLHVISVPEVNGFQIEANWQKNVYEVIVYFKKTSKYLPFQKFTRYLKAQNLGYKKIKEEFGKIDLVHLNVFFPAGIFALRLKRRFQIPFVVTEHLTAFLDINPYEFNFIEKYFIKKIGDAASMICPVSIDLKNAIERFGIKGPYEVIPNVVDTDLFQAPESRSKGPIQLLHVSMLLDQHKNISGILNVVARLYKERQDFRITFAGNKFGDLHFKKAASLGIPTSIFEIHDEIPLEDIAAFMQSHHIFILFSNYENLPCVISEAHASGMVVVATDVGGVREMIDAENGILIKAKEEEALFNQLNQLMDRLDQYDASSIRKKAVDRYSYQSVADQFLEIYKIALQKNST